MAEMKLEWPRERVAEVYRQPLLELVFRAATVHRSHHQPGEVQVCTLLSIKTGGCPEDCAYCPQAARYHTKVDTHRLLDPEEVLQAARAAKAAGSTRFCMGAAWREVRSNRDFDKVLNMVAEVKALGLEVCATLGMAELDQLQQLKDAGLHAYNHNLDSSEQFYGNIIGTRTYQDRLQTLQRTREAGLSVCCGGIVGMGETDDDRIDLLHTLANLNPAPESVPINALVAVEGTPLQDQAPVDALLLVRCIATARVLMPTSMVRLSAGRLRLSAAEQALCFLAGANSIFAGEKLLTTPNNAPSADAELFAALGLVPRPAYKDADLHPEAETPPLAHLHLQPTAP